MEIRHDFSCSARHAALILSAGMLANRMSGGTDRFCFTFGGGVLMQIIADHGESITCLFSGDVSGEAMEDAVQRFGLVLTEGDGTVAGI